MKNEYSIKFEKISVEDVPQIIRDRMSKTKELKKRIEECEIKVHDAKQGVIDVVGDKKLSQKQLIENLQTSSLRLANAQEESMKAHILSFEYFKSLSEFSKFLLNVSLNDIALNRAIMEELNGYIQGDSGDELSDYIKQEMVDLVNELNERQDISKRQKDLTIIVKEQASTIEQLKKRLDNCENELKMIKQSINNC